MLTPEIIDDLVAYSILTASLGGLIGGYFGIPGISMLVGGQVGALLAIVVHLVRGAR